MPLIAALAAACLSGGWARDAHQTVTAEALRLLPAPLSTYGLAHEEEILRLVMAPDARVEELRAERGRTKNQAAEAALQAERTRHFFDIDALTDEPPPLASFPHEEPAARRYVADFLMRTDRPRAALLLGLALDKLPAKLSDAQFDALGAAAMAERGSLPWTIRDRLADLTQTFKKRDLGNLPRTVAELSHFVADLHQPFHTTINYDGKLTGNEGIHRTIDANVILRHRDYYRRLPAAGLKPYDYVADVPALVFGRIGENQPLVARLLAADAEARRRSGATPEDFLWMKALSDADDDALFAAQDLSQLEGRGLRLVRHADALEELLRKDDDVLRRRLGEAASTLASLIYTAWLAADRPALSPPPAQEPAAEEFDWVTYLPLVVIVGIVVVLLAGRRRTPPNENSP